MNLYENFEKTSFHFMLLFMSIIAFYFFLRD